MFIFSLAPLKDLKYFSCIMQIIIRFFTENSPNTYLSAKNVNMYTYSYTHRAFFFNEYVILF